MRPWHRCFSVNFVKFLRTPFFIEHIWWLLLSEKYSELLRKSTLELFTKMQAFFIGNILISNARLKLAKKQAKAKNTLKLNFCYLKIIRFFHPRCHPKIIADILKKVPKTSASMSISMRLYN